MPIVTMPDGTPVSFPDDMPKEQIKSLILSKFPDAGGVQQPVQDVTEQVNQDPVETVPPQINSNPSNGIIDQLARQVGLAGRYTAEGLAGLTDIPNMVVNAGTSAINSIAGTEVPQLDYPSNLVSKGLSAAGVPSPNTPMERVVGDMSRAVAGTGGSLATSVSKTAAKYLPSLSKMAQNPMLQMRAAIGSSGAAGATREAGGGPLAQLGAGLAGGTLATIGSVPKKTYKSSDDIRSSANYAYQDAEKKGGFLKDTFTDKFVAETQKALPQTAAGKIVSGETPVTKIIDRITALKGKSMSLAEAQEIDEFLGDAIDGMTDMGKLTKEGKKLHDVQSSLRNMIDNVDPSDVSGTKEGFDALKNGRKLWSQSAKLRDVEKIITRSEMMENPAQAIKAGFRNLYNNPERIKGFNKQEKELIKKAAESGVITDALRTFGSRLIPIGSSVVGGPLSGVASYAASAASRGAASKLQLNKAQNLANLVSGEGTAKNQKDIINAYMARILGTGLGLNATEE